MSLSSAQDLATPQVGELVTTSEAALLLNVTRRTFERWVSARKVVARDRNDQGYRLFSRDDIDALIEERGDRRTLADQPGPVVLPGQLTVGPDWLRVPTGVLRPAWLRRDPRGALELDRPAPGGLIAQFVRIVAAYAPAHHCIGTFGARIIDAPCESAGAWHSDAGGVRYVAVAHVDPERVTHCGQQFRAKIGQFGSSIAPSNRIAAYTTAEHRSPPGVPEGRRIFLSATTYADPADVDLSYSVLAGLRSEAFA
jgi:excisionase family DNA binding protein